MSKKSQSKLSLDPQNIDGENWYYEARTGIELCHQVKSIKNKQNGVLLQTDHIKIPWRMLRRSLERRDAE